MSYYQQWQKEKYGSVINEYGLPEEENGSESIEADNTWVENEAAINLIEQEF